MIFMEFYKKQNVKNKVLDFSQITDKIDSVSTPYI